MCVYKCDCNSVVLYRVGAAADFNLVLSVGRRDVVGVACAFASRRVGTAKRTACKSCAVENKI